MDYEYRFATVDFDLDFWKDLNKKPLHPAASGNYMLQKHSQQIDVVCLFWLHALILLEMGIYLGVVKF